MVDRHGGLKKGTGSADHLTLLRLFLHRRAATIVAAFLMLRKGMSGMDALRSIHIRKPVRPNDGFLRQLVQLEADITR